VIDFWNATANGKPFLSWTVCRCESLRGATGGYATGLSHPASSVRGSEIPSDTTPFAKALDSHSAHSIENNGAGSSHHLPGARTESMSAAWDYCSTGLPLRRRFFLAPWPDERVHQLAEPGDGFQRLCRETAQHLTSDAFWKMVEHMATGRRVLITSDHGYASSGMFTDVTNKEQAGWLKTTFGSSRFSPGLGAPSVPTLMRQFPGHNY